MANWKTNLRWDYGRGLWRNMNYVCIDVSKRGPTDRWVAKCERCGKETLLRWAKGICYRCRSWYHDRLKALSQPAHAKVHTAIERGELPRLDGSVPCADCGRPAQQYDHREYAKPLEVQPVCRRCNIRRGPAKEAEPLWRKRVPSRRGGAAACPESCG